MSVFSPVPTALRGTSCEAQEISCGVQECSGGVPKGER